MQKQNFSIERKEERKRREKEQNEGSKVRIDIEKNICVVFFFLLRPVVVFSLFHVRERFVPWLLELTCKTLANIGKHAWLNRLSGLLVLDSSLCLFSTHLPSFLASLLSTFFFLKRIFSRIVLRVLRIVMQYVIHCQLASSFLSRIRRPDFLSCNVNRKKRALEFRFSIGPKQDLFAETSPHNVLSYLFPFFRNFF